MTYYALEPATFQSQKSFYGKAHVIVNPKTATAVLISYETPVAMVKDGKFYRLWDDYSLTTMKHINAFRARYHLSKLTANTWNKLDVTNSEIWN